MSDIVIDGGSMLCHVCTKKLGLRVGKGYVWYTFKVDEKVAGVPHHLQGYGPCEMGERCLLCNTLHKSGVLFIEVDFLEVANSD